MPARKKAKRKTKQPRPGAFRPGPDPRRHKFTPAQRSKGGRNAFQKLVNGEGTFADPDVYNYVSIKILQFYRANPRPR